MDDPRVAIAAIQERIGSLDGKVVAAHARVDKMELLIRDDLKEIKSDFKEVSEELKTVIAWQNSSKGSLNTWLLVGTMLVSLLGSVASKFF